MFNLQVTSTTMELLPLVCLCLLTRSGTTFAEEGSKVINVEEDSDVTLPCSLSSKEDIESNRFVWRKDGQKEVFLYFARLFYYKHRVGQDEQFKGRVSHFPDKLKHGDASIIIRNTKVADSGDYICAFPRLWPSQIFHIQLVVGRILKDRSGENIPGAAPKPHIKKFQTKDGALLLCVVLDASPKPKVEWQDRAGNILPAGEPQVSETGGRYITLNTTVTKTDRYRCVATQEDINHQINATIDVDIRGPKVIRVEEDSDVTLPCSLSTKENIELKLFDWKKDDQKVFLYDAGFHSNNGRAGQDQQFKGRVSHFPDKLEHSNASIIIRNTKVADSGNYTCAFPRLWPSQIFHIRLVVDPILKDRSGENIPGAAAKPSVMTLNATNDRALLQCKVQGASPKPKVEWQDSAGNILPAEEPQVSERGGSYNIILQTTVTKTDRYRCVATQEDINHQIYAETFVYISGSKVITVEEDSDVTLPCSLSPKENIEFKLFVWKKDGQKDVFLYDGGLHYNNGREGQDEQFNGRVSHFPDELKHGDASIKIRNTRVTDSGDYTCAFPRLQPRQIFHIRLVVGSKVIRVEEDSDVTLPCWLSSKEDIEFKLFDWKKDGQKDVFLYDAGDHYNNGREGQDEQFKGRVSHFPDKLKHGDASIKIINTKVADSGDYTCAFPRLQPSQIFHIRLVVGAAPKPDIMKFEAKDGALLQCVVHGSPKPKVEWQDRAGKRLPAKEPQVSETGGSFYIILQTTVTKTDRYRCVATQEEISHQIYAEIDVDISGFPTGLIVGTAFCALLVGVVVFLSWFYSRRRSTQNAQRDSPQQPTTSNDTLPTDQADQLTSNDQCSTM